MVSNVAQGSDDNSAGIRDRAQPFTTGTNSAGYTLTSVEIISEDSQGDDAALSVCTVDESGFPTSTCTSLTAPSSFTAGTLEFTAPANTTLAANTTYTLLIQTPGGETLTLDTTTSTGEDTGGAAGWSIADTFHFKNASDEWNVFASSEVYRMTIKGTLSSSNSPATGAPAITGHPQVAAELTAGKGNIADTDGLTKADAGDTGFAYTYQWIREDSDGSNPADIMGATSSTYTLADADAGKKIKVNVSFKDDDGNSEERTSAAFPETGTIRANSPVTGTVTISGFPNVGEVLSASRAISDTDGIAGVTYSYQWIREDSDGSNPVNISGATSNRYTLADADQGKKVKAKLSFTDNANNQESVTSDAYPSGAATIAPAFSPTGTAFTHNLTETSGQEISAGPSTGAASQAFTTGPNSGGYTLSSIDILYKDAQGDAFSAKVYTTDANGGPTDTEVATLNAPGSFTRGLLTFMAPATNTTLMANTTYALLLRATGSQSADLDATNSDADNPGTSGWSIADSYHFYNTGTNSWQLSGTGRSVRMAINGSVITTGSTDATLSALSLGTGITLSPTFAAATTSYTAWVPNGTSSVTVTATRNHNAATVVIANDDDTNTPNTAEIDLDAGRNAVTVTVTAEDMNTTETYEVTVVREAAAPMEDPDALLTANVTAGESGDGNLTGYNAAGTTYGAMTDRDFDFDGETYEIEQIVFSGDETDPFFGSNQVGICFTDTMAPADAVRNRLVLSIGSHDMPLSGMLRVGSSNCYRRARPSGLSKWEWGDVAEVKITLANRAATGAPSITGTARVGGTLTAGKGNIADTDGLTKADNGDAGFAYAYQWVRVDGGSDTNITGADSATYTLVAADEGKKVKVKASFKDDRENPETRTSAETATIGAANNAPTAEDSSVTTQEDTAHTFAAGEFGFSDTDSGDALSSVRIVTLPASGKGTLALSGTAVSANDAVTKAELDNGDLVYTPPANANGTGYASFTFKVSDGTDESASAYTMTINVTAVNDPPTGKPVISGTAQVGQTLTADVTGISDPDGISEEGYTYEWISVDGGSDTPISGTDERMYTLMDTDAGKKVKVKVSFTDTGGTDEEVTSDAYPSGTGTIQPVTPNSPPAFANPSETREVEENSGANVDVGAPVAATDPDSGDTLTYSLEGADGGNFEIDTSTGQISTKTGVTYDHETKGSHSVTVKVSDGSLEATVSVTINITDVNEKPATPGAPAVMATTGSTMSITVNWTEPGRNGGPALTGYDVQYKKSSEPDSNYTGHAHTGTATSTSITGLDEGTPYQVRVRALNGETPSEWSAPGTGSTNSPANNAPMFSTMRASRSISAGAGGNTNVGAPVTATDSEGDPLTYTLEGADKDSFTIDSSGQIRTRSGITYDRTTYMVTVKAEDPGGLSASIAVTITVRRPRSPVIKPPPNSPPVFTEGNTAQRSFPESAAGTGEGTRNVGAPVTAADPDGDTLVYTLSGADNDSFTIDSNTGQISTVSGESYDYETKTAYEVAARADDGAGAAAVITVTINLSDVAEVPGAVGRPRVRTGGPDALEVSWSAPDNTGRPQITGYGLRYREGTDGVWSEGPRDLEGTEALLSGLGEGTLYEVQVRALNSDGAGQWSESAAGRTSVLSRRVAAAWLARFGRTVAEHVLSGVEGRINALRSPGTDLSLGIESFLPSPREPGEQGDWFSEWRTEEEEPPRFLTLAGYDPRTASSFTLTGETPDGGFGAVWGRGTFGGFGGREDGFSLRGDVTTVMAGADYAWGSWVGGAMFGRSFGEGSYAKGKRKGKVSSSVTGIYPYAGKQLSEDVSVWGALGYARGEFTVTGDGAKASAGLSLRMAAGGVRGEIVSGEGDRGIEAAVRADTLFVRTASGEARGIEESTADVSRLRLGVEFSLGHALEGGMLRPMVEAGVRRDGGDAETGFGADVGGGLQFSVSSGELLMEIRGRALLAHQAGGLSDWGVSGALRFDPSPHTPRGFGMSLTHSAGGSAGGGAQGLLERATLEGLGEGRAGWSSRLGGEAGYGFGVFGGGFTGTPYVGFGTSGGHGSYRAGWRVESAYPSGFTFGVEATRDESAYDPIHGMTLRLTVSR